MKYPSESLSPYKYNQLLKGNVEEEKKDCDKNKNLWIESYKWNILITCNKLKELILFFCHFAFFVLFERHITSHIYNIIPYI